MDITGKIYVFANKYKTKKGDIMTRCSTNISEQDKDGNVISRFYIDVKFRGDNAPKKEQIEDMEENVIYEIDVKKGFLSCRSYEKDGETKIVPEIVVMECKVTDAKKVKKTQTKKKTAKSAPKKTEEETDDVDDVKMPF